MISLEVEVPIACFRVSRAREYAETYPVPPPATVYGMLLSMVGELDRYQHCGVKLAIALLSEPEKSTVIRTFRRFKNKEIFHPTNARPDYQELLSDIRFVVWVASGTDAAQPRLSERLRDAIANPETVNRFGGLSLGESRDLINAINLLPENYHGESLQWLVQQEDGLLTLPSWVDHVGSQGTRWARFQLLSPSDVSEPPENAWIEIQSSC
ncbi:MULTISPECIES: type I-MYXAN CRISPR-associated protein Cas5/Cmx5/DevS [unclassified Coleofasciculus]|uniref:type I-MYXAN CRISPR-associated protein Cas5/Cmx5/DevS n=1 Tax=unclassified Coleofasciculus TaxID=2692782 RepID=UPI00188152AB|nr:MULTISPECIES: type I-MYXAN CRISPR-associated protein Cas5/Cmx5/DevS [unclassified Coleofasciculus]MBE9125497.1 type I-MYXAN CRISPR-associated protein Cas5/Cmx5/DevS [Coleofasciculus sp. LEGE 07081]MBE9148639.1 type I-MYXAN CRISPR-associated protein Cas5/Cmx5/DevS [Coleofasciculus sp. LEGE 07092]